MKWPVLGWKDDRPGITVPAIEPSESGARPHLLEDVELVGEQRREGGGGLRVRDDELAGGLSERGVRLAQKTHVGPCAPVGIQRSKAEVGPASGPTWRLSYSGGRSSGGEATPANPPPPFYAQCRMIERPS